MIQKEIVVINNRRFTRTYSDAGYLIERDGMRYAEAVDPEEYQDERVYVETDEYIEGWTDEATVEDYQNTLRELGVLTDE